MAKAALVPPLDAVVARRASAPRVLLACAAVTAATAVTAVAPCARAESQGAAPDASAVAAAGPIPNAGPPDAGPAPKPVRSGVVVGLMAGLGVAGSSGYPKAASKIDDPAYYSSSNLLAGSGGTFFVLGSLTDYLSFGFWFGGATFESNDWRSTGSGGGVRVEVFPFGGIAPRLKNLGLLGQAGLGVSKLHEKAGIYPDANGSQSFLSAGVFYEIPLFKMIGGHVALGPSLEYDAIFTPSIERHSAMLGARLAFYGGS